ncbi:hypothetical protein PAECIP112173_00366 [Paenibacillus sp. JJ-100]|nr:hypothetical protein PAECIP112173_00366 [Paenibacillus sp. JJ-100]
MCGGPSFLRSTIHYIICVCNMLSNDCVECDKFRRPILIYKSCDMGQNGKQEQDFPLT